MRSINKRRVVITGMGVVACNGIGTDEFWNANRIGKSGLSLIEGFETECFSSRVGGEVHGFDPLNYMPKDLASRVDRFVHFGLAAAEMAIQQSGIDLRTSNSYRVGTIIGSGLGGQLFHEQQMVAALSRGAHRIHPTSVARITPNAVASHIAIRYGLRGANLVISTACASGAHAIGEAFRKIQLGELDWCVTGGVEAPLTHFNFGAYCALRVLSKRIDDPTTASRPFDRTRDGFVMSEGGAVLILEEYDHAMRRGATLLAEVVGYASNSGAHHVVMPDPEGNDAAQVMRAALCDAERDQADYVNAHATSTRANDAAETRAIKAVFGKSAYSIPISSTKSMIGHALGAAGAIEAVVSVKAIENDFVPPTINLGTSDPDCDLDYVPNVGRKHKVTTVLSNSFGFGNCNVALVFSKVLPE